MISDHLRLYLCILFAATFWIVACIEATAAQRWHRRTGRWTAYRVAGVVIFAALAAIFSALAFT